MPLRTVLCPTDFSPLAERGVDMASGLCPRLGARLVLEHNLAPRPPDYLSVKWMWTEDHEREDEAHAGRAEARLREMLSRLPASLPREARLTRGPVDLALLQVARLLPADLIVMGSHGGSRPEHHSLTESIITRAPCPVLTLTTETEERAHAWFVAASESRPIPSVVPVDFSRHGLAAARHAFALREILPLEIHLLHVLPAWRTGAAAGETARTRATRERLDALVPRSASAATECHVVAGESAEEIVRFAEQIGAALLVVGCHPKGMVRRWFSGATSCAVLHGAPCPVWFLPAGVEAGAIAAGAAA